MIRPDQIPDEAVEAAAEAVCDAEFWAGEWKKLHPDSNEAKVYCKQARAAIAAALNAWPGWEGRTVDGDILRETIILLLPQEKRETDLRIEMAPKNKRKF